MHHPDHLDRSTQIHIESLEAEIERLTLALNDADLRLRLAESALAHVDRRFAEANRNVSAAIFATRTSFPPAAPFSLFTIN